MSLLSHENCFQYLKKLGVIQSFNIEHKSILPYSYVGNGNQSQKISKNADNDYEGAVDSKTKSPVCDFLRLAITVVSQFVTLWIPNALSVTFASDLLHHSRRHRD